MDDFTKEVNQRTLSNSNNRDKAFITISTAVIAGTATFLQADSVGLEVWILFASWLCFLVVIVAVVKSFDASNDAHKALLKVHNYYIGLDNRGSPDSSIEDDLNSTYKKLERKMNRLDRCASWAFLIGLIVLTIFGTVKLGGQTWQRNSQMERQSRKVDASRQWKERISQKEHKPLPLKAQTVEQEVPDSLGVVLVPLQVDQVQVEQETTHKE